MNLRHYLVIFSIGTLLAWVAWFMVLMNMDPVTQGIIAVIMFYLTLFVGITGLLATVATVVRTLRFPQQDLEGIIQTSLRQSTMLGLLMMITLLLLRKELLTWWTILLLILVVVLIEFFLLSAKGTKNQRKSDI